MSRTESAAAVARGEDVREDTQNVETSVFTEDDQQILDLDSEVITNVHLDGMALMKMIKHCKDNHAVNGSNAWGALLGMDMGGTLEAVSYTHLTLPTIYSV